MTLPPMTEDQLQASILELARRLGWLAYHTHDSRRSAKGFPDLVLAHPRTGACVFAELKSARGRVTAEQDAWLRALAAGGRAVFVWRPEAWPDSIADVLKRGARGPLP